MQFIDEYSDLARFKPATFRQKGRKVLLDGLSAGYRAIKDYEELFRRPRIQFLYIHHVFNDEGRKLANLLEHLSRYHDFISYSGAIDKIEKGEIDRSYICISSDDGLKNNIRAASVMDSLGIKGCFFICPSIIGEKKWETIAEFSKERLHFPPVEFMDWKEVDFLQQQGHEIGGHTMSHVNMARSSMEELAYEVPVCYDTIKEKCGKPEHFAFPYGRYGDFTPPGRDLVFDSGFTSFASAERGCHITLPREPIRNRDLLVRRDHVLLSWPLEHILFFIARNAEKASPENNFFPHYANSDTDKQP